MVEVACCYVHDASAHGVSSVCDEDACGSVELCGESTVSSLFCTPGKQGDPVDFARGNLVPGRVVSGCPCHCHTVGYTGRVSRVVHAVDCLPQELQVFYIGVVNAVHNAAILEWNSAAWVCH